MGSEEKEMQQGTWQQGIVQYLHDLIRTLVVILLTFLLIFRIIIVSGDSMYTTLYDGDYLLLLTNLFYHSPEQGDIIVISKKDFDNGAPIVKRVIATEGQQVDIDEDTGTVYVDGEALQEAYINTLTTAREGVSFPLTVKENCIFVMGDNRAVSKDSRSPDIGQIDKREVLGKALFLFLPGVHHGNHTRDFDRIGAVQ